MGCNELRPEKEELAPLATTRPASALGHGGDLKAASSSSASKLSEEDAKLVVAKVGERVITLGELEDQLEEQPIYVRVRYNTLEKKKEFLDNIIRFELLAQEAVSRGYDKDRDVVFSMKQQMVKKLMEKDMEGLVSMQDITDEKIAGFYEENRQMYFKPEACRVSQLVVNDLALANEILSKLQADFKESPRKRRQTFTSAVDLHTTDSLGRAMRGDTGFFTVDGKDPETLKDLATPLVAPLREAAFKLEKINGLSPVVSVDGKHSILLLTNRRPEVSKPLKEVRRQIRNKLFRDEQEDARKRFVDGLRGKADVVVHEDKLALLKDRAAKGEVPGVKEVQRLRKHVEAKGMHLPKKEEKPAGEESK
jgi:parvulin-like peptidyl-prolyl isomerase